MVLRSVGLKGDAQPPAGWREVAGEREPMAPHEQWGVDDDHALLARAAAGDTAALGALYDRYGRLVYGVAMRITGDSGSAEEVTQDTFLRLWQHAARYSRERGSLVGWMLTVAQRRAIDELRSRRGTTRRREVMLPEGLPDHDGLDLATLSQLRTDLKSALAELPAAQRETIELMFFGGLSRQEIARRADCPLPTIHTRVRLGMEKLRTIMQRGEHQSEVEEPER